MPRVYKITGFDTDLDDIAARFHVHPQAITEMNPNFYPDGLLHDSWSSLVGQYLNLPEDPSLAQYDWVPYMAAAGETLEAICAKKNKHLGIDPLSREKDIPTPPFLTPDYLLNVFPNADLRAAHGSDPGSFTLTANEPVMIPIPLHQAGPSTVRIAPNSTTPVNIPPPWIQELTNYYESIRDRTRQFERSNRALRDRKAQAMREIQVLYACQGVLALELHDPVVHSRYGLDRSNLNALDSALRDLTDLALTEMYSNVNESLDPKLQHATMRLGRQILKDLRASRFEVLTKKLIGVLRQYPRACNELCDAVAYAYQTIADSPLCDEIKDDIDGAAKYLAALRPIKANNLAPVDQSLAEKVEQLSSVAPGEPVDAVQTLLSILGIPISSVGNLPGTLARLPWPWPV